jgi:hypothetical protein
MQNLPPTGDFSPTHPTGQDRFFGCRRVALQLLGGQGWVSHRLRSQNDQQAIAVWILRRNLKRFGVAFRVGISQNVHRVAMAPVCWEHLVKCGKGLG